MCPSKSLTYSLKRLNRRCRGGRYQTSLTQLRTQACDPSAPAILGRHVRITAAPLFQQLVWEDPQTLFSVVYVADVQEVDLAMEGVEEANLERVTPNAFSPMVTKMPYSNLSGLMFTSNNRSRWILRPSFCSLCR